jgi:hypothetical protein
VAINRLGSVEVWLTVEVLRLVQHFSRGFWRLWPG